MLNSNQELRTKCDRFAPYYDRSEYLSEILGIRKLRKKLIKNAYGRVLELGIGTGKNLTYYPDSCKLVGTDFSLEMLNISCKRAKSLHRNINLYIMDSENLAFPDHSFDTVVDTFNLCTYTNHLNVLEEAKRVCKKDGKILLLEHGRSKCSLLAILQNLTAEKHAKTMGCNWDRDIYSILGQSGLEIENIEDCFLGIFVSVRAMPN